MAHILTSRPSPVSGLGAGQTSRAIPVAAVQLLWFAAISALAFLIPFGFTSVIDLHHDVYYLAYFASVFSALAMYAGATGFDVKSFILQNWRFSLVLGAGASVFLVWNVIANNDATSRPDGPYFAFEVLWRGVAYGTVDALLLTAFPGMVAFSLLKADVRSIARRIAFALIALPLVLVITATYHLGYGQFRDDGVQAPETGNVIISIPMLVTTGPVGSVLAHSSMHVAAVSHAYETDVFLPPKVTVD
jgi:hypothetical protein